MMVYVFHLFITVYLVVLCKSCNGHALGLIKQKKEKWLLGDGTPLEF